jgi:hypothetical protein
MDVPGTQDTNHSIAKTFPGDPPRQLHAPQTQREGPSLREGPPSQHEGQLLSKLEGPIGQLVGPTQAISEPHAQRCPPGISRRVMSRANGNQNGAQGAPNLGSDSFSVIWEGKSIPKSSTKSGQLRRKTWFAYGMCSFCVSPRLRCECIGFERHFSFVF